MTYIDPRHKAFSHLDRLAGWKQGDKPAPVTVEWDLSNRCTLGCQDCHFAHTHVKGPWASRPRVLPMAYDTTGDLADTGVVRRVLRDVAKVDPQPIRSIVWSGGGEPTTHPDVVDIVTDAWRFGFRQGMYTLGGLVTYDLACGLRNALEWVVVSLDCADAQTYSAEKGVPADRFEAACRGVRYLVGGSAVVGVSFLLHAGNWWRTDDMLMLSRTLGASYTTFRPTIQTKANQPAVCDVSRRWIDAALPDLQRLAQEPDVELDVDRFLEYRDWTGHGYQACYGIRLNATITPDGRVWICPQRRGVAGSCLGDLRTESFVEIWKRHPGQYAVDEGCRVMCRLHPVNQTLAGVYADRKHEAFI